MTVPAETAKFTLSTEVMLWLEKYCVTCVRFSDVRLADEELLDELLLDEPADVPPLVPDFVSVVPGLPEAVSRSAGLVVSPALPEAVSRSPPGLPEAVPRSSVLREEAGLFPLPAVP